MWNSCSTINYDLSKAINELKGNRSIRQMSRDTGVASSYISGILKGKYFPSLKIIQRLTSPKSNPQCNTKKIFDLINPYLKSESEKVEIIVFTREGVIQSVQSSLGIKNINVTVVDWDNYTEDNDPDGTELKAIKKEIARIRKENCMKYVW